MIDPSTAIVISSACTVAGAGLGALGMYLRSRNSNGKKPAQCPSHATVEARLARGDERFDEMAQDIKSQGKLIAQTRETLVKVDTRTEIMADGISRLQTHFDLGDK